MTLPPPSHCRLDHLVICANDLAQGVEWFSDLSGVWLPVGGAHPLMGTHNHLAALSDDSFLEIIAIDPNAQPAFEAGRKRWFSLDDEAQQVRRESRPRLTTWVVATADLDASIAVARETGIDPGFPVTQTRGDLQWRLSLHAEGSLTCGGVFPVLIEWPEGVNPVARMRDQGLRLEALELFYPEPDKITTALVALGLDGLVTVREGDVSMQAELQVGSRPFSVGS